MKRKWPIRFQWLRFKILDLSKYTAQICVTHSCMWFQEAAWAEPNVSFNAFRFPAACFKDKEMWFVNVPYCVLLHFLANSVGKHVLLIKLHYFESSSASSHHLVIYRFPLIAWHVRWCIKTCRTAITRATLQHPTKWLRDHYRPQFITSALSLKPRKSTFSGDLEVFFFLPSHREYGSARGSFLALLISPCASIAL